MVGSEVSWHGTPAADAVFLIDSFFGKLVAAITVSLLIGIVVDLSISVAHPFGATTTLQVPGVSSFCTTCGVLGALAGGGAGGPVGAAVGFLWGWVLSKLVDSTTSKYVSELMRPVTIPAISWLAAALAGWMAGRTASRWFSKLAAGRPTLARFIGAIAVIAALASAAIVLLQFGLWMSPRLADIPPLMAQVLSVLWRPVVAVIVWLGVIGCSVVPSYASHIMQEPHYRWSAYPPPAPYTFDRWWEFYRRHPRLLLTWLTCLCLAAFGTVAFFAPELWQPAAYVLGGVCFCVLCLAGQWYVWVQLADAGGAVEWSTSDGKAPATFPALMKESILSPWLLQGMPPLVIAYVATVLLSVLLLPGDFTNSSWVGLIGLGLYDEIV